MASLAHCYYCFEVLVTKLKYDAEFASGEPEYIKLRSVLDLYVERQKELEAEIEETRAVVHTADQVEEQYNVASGQLQLPSISRLRDPAPSSGASSTSTPSTMSVNSSHTQLTNATSISDTTSRDESRSPTSKEYPLFVTWNILSRSGNKSLRGCIGTFEALPLEEGLKIYANTSALEDTRFHPIDMKIVPSLSCSLTLLADFEECDGPMDWELGKHGIRITFTHKYRKHGATYLPDVAVEQGWTQEETLESLMRKAGWESHSRRFSRGSGRPWEEVRDFRVVRYTGLKSSASYSEWQEWQKWAKQKQPEIWL